MDNDMLPQRQSYPSNAWVQTERKTHEAWAQLSAKSPKAGALLHYFAARVGEQNAVIASHKIMADWLGCSTDTVKRAIIELRAGNWLEVRRSGPGGGALAYVLNDRVVWSQARDGLRYSLFTAAVVVSEEDQPDRSDLGDQAPLKKLPRMQRGERQLPAGPGMPPPSQPSLPTLDPDTPAIREDRSGAEEARSVGHIAKGLGYIEDDNA